MKVSLNTVKQLVNFDLPPVDELVRRINQQLGGVEKVTELGPQYKDAIVVRVTACEKHPNADKLTVCHVDDGGVRGDIERDENGFVQVVCGAPNVHTDMWAVWLPPESIVPSTFGTNDEFILGARELRGIMSQGMLAAGDELAINNDHDGIVEITDRDVLDGKTLQPGASFAEMFDLNDTIIDIENKMFTHRPDCFGQLGIAREIHAIVNNSADNAIPFPNPDWYTHIPQFDSVHAGDLTVFNDVAEKVPRYMAVLMSNVTVEKSPLWMQTTLLRWGSKSINTVVDLTNYIMLLTAQPTHAYDAAKLRDRMLGARMAQEGEMITLLNGKTYNLTSEDIVIADGEGAVGLAGIMGGGDSEVDDATTEIVLEAATFDMYTLRKSAMRHGVFTDALTRFNKGQSPLQNDRVLAHLMALMEQYAGASQTSSVYDLPKRGNIDERQPLGLKTTLNAEFINQRLGTQLEAHSIADILQRANFDVQLSDDNLATLTVVAPFWRTDIEQPEDIVEEVGRLYGFDMLPRELPRRSSSPAPHNTKRTLKQQIREQLSKSGANEVLSYSFVHENTLRRAGQDPSLAYRLSNALSPDLQYYRLSLTPSLLDKVHMNSKSGYNSFALFEIGKSHLKNRMEHDEPNVPLEETSVAFVVAATEKERPTGAAYFCAKRYATQILNTEQVDILPMNSVTLLEEYAIQLAAPYQPERSSVVVADGKICGVIGEFSPAVAKAFKLPAYAAGFELRLDIIPRSMTTYRSLSRFPSTSQDISLESNSEVTFMALHQVVQASANDAKGSLDVTVEPLGIYQSPENKSQKTTTFHLVFTHQDRTLTDDDIKPIMDAIADRAHKELDATRA